MEFMEYLPRHQIENVKLFRPNKASAEGTLCITGHFLLLVHRNDPSVELWLLHKSVDALEKRISDEGDPEINLKCKDFKLVKLQFSNQKDCDTIFSSIEALSNIDDIRLSYPFYNNKRIDMLEDGWTAFTPESEFNRMKNYIGTDWRLSNVNKGYKVCSSYPEAVIVLKSIDDATIEKAAQFRQNGRFPVLSYYHKQNGVVILRCSQPMSGISTKRSREDEHMVNSILGNGKRIRGYIVDTRSVNQVKLNTTKGGGAESEAFYPQWRRNNQPIERASTFHDSLYKLMEACFDFNGGVDRWLSRLDASNWMTLIKDALTCACSVASCVEGDASVLVHGGEGTDTTLIVTSLAQILLDQDCRTITGFEALVYREWFLGGHPFSSRCYKSGFVPKQKQEAPTFLIFLDCVWQIWQQYPCSFGFNENFLIVLFQNTYVSQFGTFLCDSEQEREQYKVKEKTISLWSYLNCPRELCKYMNPLYSPNPTVLWPSVAPLSLQLWTSLYQSWHHCNTAYEEMWDETVQIKEDNKECKSNVIKMRKYLLKLEKEAYEKGFVQMNSEDLI